MPIFACLVEGSNYLYYKLRDSRAAYALHTHSPELQPAERLWALCYELLASRVLTSLDELEQVQVERRRWLQVHPECIRGRTSFHWRPFLDTTYLIVCN